MRGTRFLLVTMILTCIGFGTIQAKAKEKPVLSSLAAVDTVKAGSAAARAGMKAGDVVVALNGKKNPTLEEVLTYKFDWEYAGDTVLDLRRGGERVGVALPQGEWGCGFRADLSEPALKELGEARDALKKSETLEEGRKRWEALAGQADKVGSVDAALWLRLELGRALKDARRWKEAEEVLAPLEPAARETTFWRFLALVRLGQSFRGAGDGERAAAAYARMRDAAKASGSALRLAHALAESMDFEWQKGMLPETKKLAEEVLAIRERAAPGSLDVAASFINLGAVCYDQGDLASARGFYQKALAIEERLAPSSLDTAACINNLGNLANKQGDLAAAKEYHLKALAIRQALAPEGLDVARSLNNLGNVTSNQGDLAAAREYYLKALAIKERLAPDSLDVASSLDNMGFISDFRGDLAAAREYHIKALAIRERLAPDSLKVAASLGNLGNVACDQGDLAAARECYLKALAIRERLAPDSLDLATSFSNLGSVAYDQGDLAASKEYHLKALAIQERLAPDSLAPARSLTNLGTVASGQGDLAAAEEFGRKALAIQEKLAPESLDVAASLANLGAVARERGDLAAARASYLKALAIQERLAPGSLSVARNLDNLAEIAREEGDLAKCAELLSKAVDTLENQRGRAGGESAKTTFSAAHGDFYTDLIAAYLDSKKPQLALETVERSRARALLEMVSSRYIDLKGEIPDALIERQRDLARQRKRLAESLSEADAKTDSKEIDSWRAELLMLPQKEDALAEEIRRASPRLAALEYPKPLDYKGIAAALEPETLLVAYAVAEKETCLFTLLRGIAGTDQFQVRRLSLGKKDIEIKVRSFRALMAQGAATGPEPDAWKKPAQRLFEELLGPAAAEIAACQKILLLPDGPLHLLPFAALTPASKKLPKGLRPEPLGLQKPISIEASMTVYSALKAQRQRVPLGTASWTGFGDPVYPGKEIDGETRGDTAQLRTRGLSLEQLPGTREEIETISALFGNGAKSVLGPEATEEAVLALPKQTPYLHFACHGMVDQMFPMNSALALTTPPPPDPKDVAAIGDNRRDGLLQAWEIIQDVRIESDCVVLSACETGVGKVLGGEGVMGLTRAFFYAGARSVVVSLWPISDESTSLFMAAFYRELRAGSPKDIAIMRASISLAVPDARCSAAHKKARDSKSYTRRPPPGTSRPDYSHPFYWAAFQLNGSGE